jgi:hypothetical protein
MSTETQSRPANQRGWVTVWADSTRRLATTSRIVVGWLIGSIVTLAMVTATAQDVKPATAQDVKPAAGQDVKPAAGQDVKAEERPGKASGQEPKPIGHWIGRLGSDQFAQRQQATMRLAEYGEAAVKPLVEVAESGDLELTRRVINILQTLATNQPPDELGGAWGALEAMEARGGGAAALAAKAALDDIRKQRHAQAYDALSAAGIQIGFKDVVIHARSITNQEVVLIDKKWKGDVSLLRWLRWVDRIDYAVIEGDAVRREVLEQVVRMPSLRTIVLRDATLQDDIFVPLATLSRIDDLELRYIRLAPEDADRIVKLPIRVSLGLMGTGIPIDAADKIRAALPGVNLVYKQGGFLGVVCNSFTPQCQIDDVKVGGAASNAGLLPGDIVTQIDDAQIGSFEDLQKEISTHLPGDEVDVTFNRNGEVSKVKVKLGRLDGE